MTNRNVYWSRIGLIVAINVMMFMGTVSGIQGEEPRGIHSKFLGNEEPGAGYKPSEPGSEIAQAQERAELIILVHDVSPVYENELRELLGIISHYGFQNRTYLFVIPDHAGSNDLRERRGFVEYLHRLQAQGYTIGLHGYTHAGPEFNCSREDAERKLGLAMEIMESVNLTPEYFLPPHYALSWDALRVILSRNMTVIGREEVITPNGWREQITNREYTWYLPRWKLAFELKRAEAEYLKTEGAFYLSIHPKAANNEAGLEFLKRFLEFVRKHKTGRGSLEPLNGPVVEDHCYQEHSE